VKLDFSELVEAVERGGTGGTEVQVRLPVSHLIGVHSGTPWNGEAPLEHAETCPPVFHDAHAQRGTVAAKSGAVFHPSHAVPPTTEIIVPRPFIQYELVDGGAGIVIGEPQESMDELWQVLQQFYGERLVPRGA
jgi:hypothetical protein